MNSQSQNITRVIFPGTNETVSGKQKVLDTQFPLAENVYYHTLQHQFMLSVLASCQIISRQGVLKFIGKSIICI